MVFGMGTAAPIAAAVLLASCAAARPGQPPADELQEEFVASGTAREALLTELLRRSLLARSEVHEGGALLVSFSSRAELAERAASLTGGAGPSRVIRLRRCEAGLVEPHLTARLTPLAEGRTRVLLTARPALPGSPICEAEAVARGLCESEDQCDEALRLGALRARELLAGLRRDLEQPR
jgi:hypothetical protein